MVKIERQWPVKGTFDQRLFHEGPLVGIYSMKATLISVYSMKAPSINV